MGRHKNHIIDALNSIAKAQSELAKTVDKHSLIIESQGQDIAALEQRVMELRNSAIHAAASHEGPAKAL